MPKIEEEIKQKAFKNGYQKLIVNIIYTSNWLNAQNNKMLKPYGLTIPQYNILRILRGQYPNPASIGLLQDRMLDKMSNASRLVDKLLLKDFVVRKECSQDRRQMDVTITQVGLNLLDELEPLMSNLDLKSLKISEEQANMFSDILDKIRDTN